MAEWLPIETAPRDGTHYLAYWPAGLSWSHGTMMETWFLADHYESAYESGEPGAPESPTHWMPLPEPPKE